MGIGKIAFLSFVDEAVGGDVSAGGNRVVRGDYFVCHRLGLGFLKPASWHFRAFEDFVSDLEGQKLADDTVDHAEECAAHLQHLVVVISRDPVGAKAEEDPVRFTPGITIFSNSEDRPAVAADFQGAILRAIEYFQTTLRAYALLEEPRYQQVSRCPSARFTAEFIFEHQGMPPTRVRDQVLMIDQGTTVYTIHLYDSPWTGVVIDDEFEAFIGSLHLA
ncbi:MAG: hypothetical protein ACKOTB_11500 [Planctomycetia bacterium]